MKRPTLRLSNATYARIRRELARNGMTMQAWLERAVSEKLERDNPIQQERKAEE